MENGKWKMEICRFCKVLKWKMENGKWKSAIKRVKSQINLSSFECEQKRRSQIWCFCKVLKWKMENGKWKFGVFAKCSFSRFAL